MSVLFNDGGSSLFFSQPQIWAILGNFIDVSNFVSHKREVLYESLTLYKSRIASILILAMNIFMCFKLYT